MRRRSAPPDQAAADGLLVNNVMPKTKTMRHSAGDVIKLSDGPAWSKKEDNSVARLSSNCAKRISGLSTSYSCGESGRSLVHDLSERVTQASMSSSKKRLSSMKKTIDLAQLNLRNMKLHGRDDDIELLGGKLRQLSRRGGVVSELSIEGAKDGTPQDDNCDGECPELILVSGVSG